MASLLIAYCLLLIAHCLLKKDHPHCQSKQMAFTLKQPVAKVESGD
jgi:hypothetical protein